jgi:hypothetical protein
MSFGRGERFPSVGHGSIGKISDNYFAPSGRPKISFRPHIKYGIPETTMPVRSEPFIPAGSSKPVVEVGTAEGGSYRHQRTEEAPLPTSSYKHPTFKVEPPKDKYGKPYGYYPGKR